MEKGEAYEKRDEILMALHREISGHRKVFGFKIQEIAVIGSILFGVTAFYLRTNDAMDRLIRSTDWLMSFAKNSDSYHSAVLGTQFEQGKPANPGYDVRPVRNVLNSYSTGDSSSGSLT